MGLDLIEMMMDIEETFDVNIPDETAQKLHTVGDCHLYVLGRIQERISKRPASEKPRPAKCVSSHVFYRFRRAFQRVCGVTKVDVRLNRPLGEILPKARRKNLWRDLQKETGLSLPKLKCPLWTNRAIAWLGILSVSLILSISIFPHPWMNLAFCVCAWTLAGRFWTASGNYLPMRLPDRWATVRDLVLGAMERNRGRILAEEGGDIWPLIREIVIRYACVSPEEITPEARFIQDLGMG